MKLRSVVLFGFVVVSFASAPATAQSSKAPAEARPIPAAPECLRLEKNIFRQDVSSKDFPLKIPRIAASLRQAKWSDGNQERILEVNPDIESWNVLSKQALPETPGLVTIDFDSEPLLLGELKPVEAAADGSFWLAAHFATTVGEKLRYEPQPHKNTVGYWTIAKDKAIWEFSLSKPGKFNVAVLQGCGRGQGGSTAMLSIAPSKDGDQAEKQTQKFQVLETGHFQNFQWKQLESVELKSAGTYKLEVAPEKIQKGALMDIRAIHLIRLPN
jgi:hypothetical protein